MAQTCLKIALGCGHGQNPIVIFTVSSKHDCSIIPPILIDFLGKDKKDVYWHYTSNNGAKAIMESGELRPSQQAVGDAVYGDGVYATKMSPKSKTKRIELMQCIAMLDFSLLLFSIHTYT